MYREIKIIPLTPTNYSGWFSMVKMEAVLWDALAHVTSNPVLSVTASQQEKDQYEKSKAQVSLLIEQSISTKVDTMQGTEYYENTPYDLVKRLEKLLAGETPEKWEQLKKQAQALIYRNSKTIEDYVHKNIEIRNQMKNEKYPEISNEETIAKFILDSISGHPDYAPYAASR